MKNLKSLEEFIVEGNGNGIGTGGMGDVKSPQPSETPGETIKTEESHKSEDKLDEDGTATATSGTTAGMGNVVSAQPASTPGAAVTGDGTTGSGDYGNPLFNTSEKDGSKKRGKKKNKKDKKKESIIQNFLAKYKGGKSKDGGIVSSDGTTGSKMLSFADFVNNDIKK